MIENLVIKIKVRIMLRTFIFIIEEIVTLCLLADRLSRITILLPNVEYQD